MRETLAIVTLVCVICLFQVGSLAATDVHRAHTVVDARVRFSLSQAQSIDAMDMICAPNHGSVVVKTTERIIEYTPDAGYEGYDVFVYDVCSEGGTTTEMIFAVTVANSRVCVVALEDRVSVDQGGEIVIDPLANDFSNYLIDNQVWLSVTAVSSPAHGSAEIQDDGRVLYTPDAGFCGTDTFVYKALEQHAWYDQAIVFVDVMCAGNDAPDVVSDNVEAFAGESVCIDVLANDSDSNGDVLTITSVTQPAHALVTVSTDGSLVRYTSPAAWTGTAWFAYTANDRRGGASTGLVRVYVSARGNSG